MLPLALKPMAVSYLFDLSLKNLLLLKDSHITVFFGSFHKLMKAVHLFVHAPFFCKCGYFCSTLILPTSKYCSNSSDIFFSQALNGKLLKTRDKNTRRDIQKELRTLSKEERKRQQLAVKDVIKNADVVLSTLTGAFSHKLDSTSFDLVIIDEAAQALEIACWIALLKVMTIGISVCT